jgi:hypothetical protein
VAILNVSLTRRTIDTAAVSTSLVDGLGQLNSTVMGSLESQPRTGPKFQRRCNVA